MCAELLLVDGIEGSYIGSGWRMMELDPVIFRRPPREAPHEFEEMPDTPETRARRAAQRQLDAYNARDIAAFVAAFHPEVEAFDLKSGARRSVGRAQLRESYGELFERCPELHASVTSRAVVGNVSFDQEFVRGMGPELVHAMAIYEVDEDELITRVWFVVDR